MSATNPNRYHRFLEPLYLNERMLLNVAAFLEGGFVSSTDTVASTSTTNQKSIGLSLGYLGQAIGLNGSTSDTSSVEHRSQRQYTIGGLHMAVLNRLADYNMIKDLHSTKADALPTMGDQFVDLTAKLLPSSYVSTLALVKTLTPLVSRIAHDFGDHFLPASFLQTQSSGTTTPPARRSSSKPSIGTSSREDIIRDVITKYQDFIVAIIDQLQKDYATSNRLEMVISRGTRAIGIVELEVEPSMSNQVRASLSGVNCHVIGKVIDTVDTRERLSLLDKTFFLQAGDILDKLGQLRNVDDSDVSKQNIKSFREQLACVIQFEIPGPAVRIITMSICV